MEYFHLYLYGNQIYVVANNKLNIYITVKPIYRGMAWKWDENTHNYNKYNISQSNKRNRQGCSCCDKSEQWWYNQFQAKWSFANSHKHNILTIVTQFSKRRIFCFGCGWSTDDSKWKILPEIWRNKKSDARKCQGYVSSAIWRV